MLNTKTNQGYCTQGPCKSPQDQQLRGSAHLILHCIPRTCMLCPQGACDSATYQPTAQDVEVITGEDGARVRRKDHVVASNQGVLLWEGGELVRQALWGPHTPSHKTRASSEEQVVLRGPLSFCQPFVTANEALHIKYVGGTCLEHQHQEAEAGGLLQVQSYLDYKVSSRSVRVL